MSDTVPLVIAIVSTRIPVVPERGTYPRRMSTPPKEYPRYEYAIYLVNHGTEPIAANRTTGGFASDDDTLSDLMPSSSAVEVGARAAVLLERPDEGAFDFTFYYDLTFTPPGGASLRGIFGVSRWGGGALDRTEEEPILGVHARVIRARAWRDPSYFEVPARRGS